MPITGASLVGLSQALERAEQAAQGLQKATQPTQPENQDRADISSEAVQLLVAREGFDAALDLAKTADEMERHTIDLLG